MIPFPNKKYSIIYADPPWSYSDSGCSGAAAAQYATMSINELKQLPVNPAGGGIAADDCVLFMWATYPKMQEALDLIEAWGFKYKSIAFQWIKQNRSGNGYFFGLGRWTRGNTEPCLIAIKGKPKRISAGVGQLVFSPLRRHSQKPAEVRDKIVELMGDLPRIELFAREAAPGWEERVDYEMDKVIQNILDPNTKATAKRKITLTIELTPDDERRTIGVQVTAKSTLAATNPVATALYVTSDGNGELVVAEMVPQVPGQMNMDGTQQEAPKLLKLVQHG